MNFSSSVNFSMCLLGYAIAAMGADIQQLMLFYAGYWLTEKLFGPTLAYFGDEIGKMLFKKGIKKC